MLFNFLEHDNILLGDKVDGNTLTTETTGTTDTMEVVLLLLGEVIVDDEGDLLDVNTTSQEIGGDEDTGGTGTEGVHDVLTFLLGHFTVHAGDGMVSLGHLLGELVDLPTGVTEDDGLDDAEGVVEIAEGVKLELLLVDINVELLDTFKGKFVTLDHDTDGVAHEALADLKDVLGHGGRDEDDLDGGRETLEDLIDLILETTGQHLVSLVKGEDLQAGSAQDLAIDHVKDTAGSTDDDLDTRLDLVNVVTDGSTTNTGKAGDVHVLTKSNDDRLNLLGQLTSGGQDKSLGLLELAVDLLQDTNGKSGSLTGTRLGLGDNITVTSDGDNGALLDGRGGFKTNHKIKKCPFWSCKITRNRRYHGGGEG